MRQRDEGFRSGTAVPAARPRRSTAQDAKEEPLTASLLLAPLRRVSAGTVQRTPPASRGLSHLNQRSARIAVMTSLASEPNAQFRSYMEDTSVILDPINASCGEQWAIFAVYDGHGGRQAAEFCQTTLHEVALEELRRAQGVQPGSPLTDESVADSLTRAFLSVDEQLRIMGAWRYGCTATLALARRSAAGLRLHVANVGDSRCIAVDAAHRDWRLSVDHRPGDPAETRRVEAAGGFVARGRVSGQLGVSRALGDHCLKNQGLTAHPHVSTRDASCDACLVIASDGLWDAMGDADVRIMVDRSMAEHSHEQAASRLVREACRRGSTDNITVLIVFFDGAPGAARAQAGGA